MDAGQAAKYNSMGYKVLAGSVEGWKKAGYNPSPKVRQLFTCILPTRFEFSP
jgi:hypothetical protein